MARCGDDVGPAVFGEDLLTFCRLVGGEGGGGGGGGFLGKGLQLGETFLFGAGVWHCLLLLAE